MDIDFICQYLDGLFEDITTFSNVYKKHKDDPVSELLMRTISSIKYKYDWLPVERRMYYLNTINETILNISNKSLVQEKINIIKSFRTQIIIDGFIII